MTNPESLPAAQAKDQAQVMGYYGRGGDVFLPRLAEVAYALDKSVFGPELALSRKFLVKEVLENDGNMCFVHEQSHGDFFHPDNFLGYGLVTRYYRNGEYETPPNKAFIVGTLVVPKAQGKGYGHRQREHLLQHCFEAWRVDGVLTTIKPDNTPMIRSNEKFGATLLRSLGADFYSDGHERQEWEISKAAWLSYARKKRLIKFLVPEGMSDIESPPGAPVMPGEVHPKTSKRYGDPL